MFAFQFLASPSYQRALVTKLVVQIQCFFQLLPFLIIPQECGVLLKVDSFSLVIKVRNLSYFAQTSIHEQNVNSPADMLSRN